MDTAPTWRAEAACRGLPTRAFFPDPEEGPSVDLLRIICEACPVREECAEAGLRQAFGIWGGLTTRERRRIRRRRRYMRVSA